MLDRDEAAKALKLQTHVWLPQGPGESREHADEAALLAYLAALPENATILFVGWGCNCAGSVVIKKTAEIAP